MCSDNTGPLDARPDERAQQYLPWWLYRGPGCLSADYIVHLHVDLWTLAALWRICGLGGDLDLSCTWDRKTRVHTLFLFLEMMHYTYSAIAPCGLTQAFRALGCVTSATSYCVFWSAAQLYTQNTVHVHVQCHHCETDGKLLCVGVWYQWKFIIASLWDCSGGRGAGDNYKYRTIFFQPELCFPRSPISSMCRIKSIICQWCVHCYHGCTVLL